MIKFLSNGKRVTYMDGFMYECSCMLDTQYRPIIRRMLNDSINVMHIIRHSTENE